MKKIFRFYELYVNDAENLSDESILEDTTDNRIKYVSDNLYKEAIQEIEDFISGKVDFVRYDIDGDWDSPVAYYFEVIDISNEILELENKIKIYKKELN